MGEGKGNFGCFGIADFVCGTGVGDEDVVDDVRGEAEWKQVGERAKAKARGVGRKTKTRARE